MLPLLALLSTPARAFCGTYVGSAGADLINHASQVVVARQGQHTTLTLANDFQGDLTDFALLIPVPEVLGPEDVRTVEDEVLATVDRYSAPRLVTYTCDDLAYTAQSAACGGVTPQDAGAPPPQADVVVEAAFTVGEYDVVVLSATQSRALLTWLDDNGYAVSADAEDLLGEYIDGGSYFLAARVHLEELATDRRWLSPLQLGYSAAVFSLPIRLGTLNADGAQDLVIYALTDAAAGQVAVSNLPERTLEDDCLARIDDAEGLVDFYAGQLDGAFAEGGGWLTEYAWSAASCDPCPEGEGLTDDTVRALGFDGRADEAFFTRLHLRYTPEEVTEDLALYASGLSAADQVRYIRHDTALEQSFPVCGLGWLDPEEAGSCPGGQAASSSGGCATGGSRRPWLLAAALGLGAALVRRRRGLPRGLSRGPSAG